MGALLLASHDAAASCHSVMNDIDSLYMQFPTSKGYCR